MSPEPFRRLSRQAGPALLRGLLRSLAPFALLGLLAGCAPDPDRARDTGCAHDGFVVDAGFPGGNIGACGTGAGGFVLRLLPEDEPINPSPWYSFRIRGAGVAAVTLDYGDAQHRYPPKVSVDGKRWELLGEDRVQVDEDRRQVRLQLQVDGTLHISAQEVMSSAWYEAWIAQLFDLVNLKE